MPMYSIKRRTIKIYQKANGDCPFAAWLEALDSTIRHRIQSRLARVAIGNLGEYKNLGDNVCELKFIDHKKIILKQPHACLSG